MSKSHWDDAIAACVAVLIVMVGGLVFTVVALAGCAAGWWTCG